MESHFGTEVFESVYSILWSNYSTGIYSAVLRGPFIILRVFFIKKKIGWIFSLRLSLETLKPK